MKSSKQDHNPTKTLEFFSKCMLMMLSAIPIRETSLLLSSEQKLGKVKSKEPIGCDSLIKSSCERTSRIPSYLPT